MNSAIPHSSLKIESLEKEIFEMTSRYKVLFLLSCCLLVGAQRMGITPSPDAVGKRNDQSPVTAADLAFLRAEPARKQKQKVATDGIQTRGEAVVLESAVVDVIRFSNSLSMWKIPGNYEKVMSRATKRGIELLQWPPKYGADKSVPLGSSRISGWKISSSSELSVRVDYGDMDSNGGLKWPPIVTWRMVFVKEDGRWKFDRYEE